MATSTAQRPTRGAVPIAEPPSIVWPEIPLWKHQRKAMKKAIRRWHNRRRGTGFFMEMATGKTRAALATIVAERMLRVLVVCPSGAAQVWEDEIALLGLPYKVLDLTEGSIAVRTAKLRRSFSYTGPYIVLVNYEMYWREPLRRQIKRFKKHAIILDEADYIKHRGSRQSRFAHTFGDDRGVLRLALTGTPITNGLQDAFSLFKFIEPRTFGTDWDDFKARYMIMGGYFQFQVKGYQNEAEANRKIANASIQVPKSKAVQLPPRLDVFEHVKLGRKSRTIYNRFAKDMVLDVTGTNDAGRQERGTIVADLTLTAIMRLHQITSGFTKTEDGVLLDVGHEKIDATLRLVEQARATGQRTVIFCRFKRDIRKLGQVFPGAVSIVGGMTKATREAARQALIQGRADVMLGQIRACSRAIDLTAASVGIFYSTTFSLDDFAQARDRLHRPGQKRHVTYYLVQADGTVDVDIYAALRAKKNLAAMVTDLDYAREVLAPVHEKKLSEVA